MLHIAVKAPVSEIGALVFRERLEAEMSSLGADAVDGDQSIHFYLPWYAPVRYSEFVAFSRIVFSSSGNEVAIELYPNLMIGFALAFSAVLLLYSVFYPPAVGTDLAIILPLPFFLAGFVTYLSYLRVRRWVKNNTL